MITIDKNVPLPILIKKGAPRKYPLSDLEVGESFFAAGKLPSDIRPLATRLRPKKFAVRTVTENGVKGVRVWRLS